MSEIEIPLAKVEHANILKALSIEAFEENYEKYGHYPPGLESINWHTEKIETDIYHTIRHGGKIIGGVHLSAHPNQEMKIEYLFISPLHQGKKIGATVIALLEEKYEEVQKWFLLTPYKDFRNHHFYEKQGYQKVGEIKPCENEEFTLYQYEKTNT
jgi:N-acetylglutamate synthase-like GNAT family acetyltransferase